MTGIAVIGMAGRVPGADRLPVYWDNLLRGRDGITRMPPGQLRGIVADALLDDPRWVGASGRIDGVYDFDPALFGMSPKEALTTDPQHRLLLSTVHQALEDACVVPGADAGRVGVFAGIGRNRHEELVRAVLAARGEPADEMALEIGHGNGHGGTKVAYRLGLRGPALAVQSACSTGLLALHQAVQALAAYDCDIAVAGVSTVRVPDEYGYLHYDGGIGSHDGYCRAFSARAGGGVAGDGVIAVVLKRLDDATADGDRVDAVVRGSAVNNDGAKSGYAMVNAASQERVIRDALLFAQVDPDEVGAVEAHGSGTPLGDAVEWAALSAVYGRRDRVLVGSVKSAVGHLREAAGLAGFVRAVYSVRTGRIPPTLHVGLPAQYVGRSETGLSLARLAQPWPTAGPRLAGVSAFGLGGTNVHVIVEEPPAPPVRPEPQPERPALVLLSAHSAGAVERTASAWRTAIEAGEVTPAEAADVSQTGRRHRRYRRIAVGHDRAGLVADLADARTPVEPTGGDVCFVFPGVGDHYQGMGAGLAELLPDFGRRLEQYLGTCGDLLGRDLRGALRPVSRPAGGAALDLRRLVDGSRAQDSLLSDPLVAHAVLFSVQLTLARSLQGLGIHPAAVTGHSLGELVAATVAGVFTEQDALRIVVRRAALVAEQPEGAMLAVGLGREQADEFTGDEVWLAAVNSPRSCVLAGARAAVLDVADRLERRGLHGRLLPSRHAFHTPLLRDAGARLAQLVAEIGPARPGLPVIANLTGNWAVDELSDPGYWQRQLTSPVLFSDALRTAAERCGVLVEIGPGQLRTLATQARAALGRCTVVASMRREYQNEHDDVVLLRCLGQLWQAGAEPDLRPLRRSPAPRRASLPATAADERRFAVTDGIGGIGGIGVAAVPVTLVAGAGAGPVTPAGATGAATTSGAAGVTAGDGLEAVLAQLWEAILGATGIRPADDFFELGGDSMMSVQLIAGIEQRLGIDVPAITVFEESTLSGMARQITAWQHRSGEPSR
ncbi:type I polyketide synthase [Dactylosporangium sp. NPDC050688]|uniref:type I polyketide synthase n=1 Tax=Dactylosporangium sp. NPDC050688 TaxID=3157217 RepID=UPI0033F259DB